VDTSEDKEGQERKLLEHLMQLDIVKKSKLNELELGAVWLTTVCIPLTGCSVALSEEHGS